MVPGRHVPLDGCLNLRDLGGYGTTDGRRVRMGCLYRSDELCSLSDADLSALSEMGIRVVFDLRNAIERAERPNRLPPDVELLERTTPPTVQTTTTIEEQIVANELPVRSDDDFLRIYLNMLEWLTPELRTIVTLAVDAPSRPLLFHCVAGKDRTGIAAALLLGLLGVPDATILDDYELTSAYYTAGRMDALAALVAQHGASPDHVRDVLSPRRGAMVGWLAHLHERWDGFDDFATSQLGLSADHPARLREALLVS